MRCGAYRGNGPSPFFLETLAQMNPPDFDQQVAVRWGYVNALLFDQRVVDGMESTEWSCLAQDRRKRTRLVRWDMQHDEDRRWKMGGQRMHQRPHRFYPAGRSPNHNNIVSRQGILQRRPLPVLSDN